MQGRYVGSSVVMYVNLSEIHHLTNAYTSDLRLSAIGKLMFLHAWVRDLMLCDSFLERWFVKYGHYHILLNDRSILLIDSIIMISGVGIFLFNDDMLPHQVLVVVRR